MVAILGVGKRFLSRLSWLNLKLIPKAHAFPGVGYAAPFALAIDLRPNNRVNPYFFRDDLMKLLEAPVLEPENLSALITRRRWRELNRRTWIRRPSATELQRVLE
jgi:hypothetical protein